MSASDRPPPARGRPRRTARLAAFDGDGGPDPALLADCVHCGFCLPACPTYALWGEEMDSPRGRITLMEWARAGEVGLTKEVVRHWDSCLGCLACVPACPSGVRYDLLLAAARDQVERRFRRPWDERWLRRGLFAILPHPARLRAAVSVVGMAERLGLMGLVRRSPARGPIAVRLRAPLELLAASRDPAQGIGPSRERRRRRAAAARPRRPAGGAPRLRVALLTGCVQRVLYGASNARASRVLAAYGAEVWVPPGQGCCGALELHGGRTAAARARMRRLIAVLDIPGVDRVVVTAAGCGSALRRGAEPFADDPAWAERAAALAARVRDVTEVLAELGPPAEGLGELRCRVAYHDACHLAQAQGVRAEPRAVLRAIPGLELLELSEPDLCCGSAGVYNLTDPEAARRLGARKAATIAAVAPDLVVAANPGCQVQIASALRAGGTPLPVLQPVDLVAAALRSGGGRR